MEHFIGSIYKINPALLLKNSRCCLYPASYESDNPHFSYRISNSDGKEVDFVLEKPNGNLWAVEVKNSDSVSAKDFNGIKLFAEVTGKDFQGGIILYSGKMPVSFGKNLWAVPHHVLWQ